MYMVDVLSYFISGRKRITSMSMRDSIGRCIEYYTLFLVNQNYSVLYWDCTVNMHCSDIYLRQRIRMQILYTGTNYQHSSTTCTYGRSKMLGENCMLLMIQLMQYAFVGWYVCIYAQFHRILQGIHGMGLVLSYTSVLYANQCSNYHNLLHYVFFFQNTMRAQCPAPGFRTQSCYGHYTFLSPALQCATCPPADSACMGLPI